MQWWKIWTSASKTYNLIGDSSRSKILESVQMPAKQWLNQFFFFPSSTISASKGHIIILERCNNEIETQRDTYLPGSIEKMFFYR